MKKDNYTSLELSRKLKDCGLESEYTWYNSDYSPGGVLRKDARGASWELCKSEIYGDYLKVPAYDILWDLCVRYAKEVFGEEYSYFDFYTEKHGTSHQRVEIPCIASRPFKILNLLQQGKKQEAEAYFKEHSILFNPNQ